MLFDNIYRQLEKRIFSHSNALKQSWVNNRKHITEALPAKYILKLLNGAQDYGEVYYKSPTGKKGQLNWCETDRLISFDDKLFVVEVKSGAFTWTSPTTDVDAYLRSIKALVEAPSLQGDRFIEYLQSTDEAKIYDEKHNEIGRLKQSDYSTVFKLAVTIDPFTELSAQAQYLRKIGIDTGKHPLWSLSVDDLRVFSDIFDNPIEFIHFAENRLRAFDSELVRLDDELDHLGLYLRHNNYVQYADELVGPKAKLGFIGYRSDIDKYFTEQLTGEAHSPLSQNMHPRLKELVLFLSSSTLVGRTQVASRLLDMDGEWRDKIFRYADEELLRILDGKVAQPLTTIGEVRVTLNIWSSPVKNRDALEAQKHTKAQMVMNDEEDRLLLELGYSDQKVLTDVNWKIIHKAEISFLEKPGLQKLADEVRGKRVFKAQALSKIGRNDQCPCGSGTKYKKCCLRN